MLIKKAPGVNSSEITDKKLYLSRRQFIAGSAAAIAGGLLTPAFGKEAQEPAPKILTIAKRGEFTVPESPTAFETATGWTNFYEFSTGKKDVKDLSRDFRTRPWTLEVQGLVKKPLTFDVDELIGMFPLEERTYRWRCVEAWSMIIPWIGFPLAAFIKKCEPASTAKFVEFTTVLAPGQMPGQRTDILKWPYAEGLRMDEAMHPLALLAVGMYGEVLPNQNGSPLRLVVPWKYGFKSAKSIVSVRFVENMPRGSWRRANPSEYGFYANVNPGVSHPRWTQAAERRIGEDGRRKTLMFNGYEEQVGRLYGGMNLKNLY
ncbi:MAG TPA: protein-methionine-sulfoxide reductase catalytic subunit MsrP [Candidatus Latescibacteria bacterium]|nr:protein-methionine-sulfoxide reductase catalytic subunit MsrP [Candidatus Latescibacterota bacterium]